MKHSAFPKNSPDHQNKKLQKNKGLGKLNAVKITMLCGFILTFLPLKFAVGDEPVSNLKQIDYLLMTAFDSLDIAGPVDAFSFGAIPKGETGYLQNSLIHFWNADGKKKTQDGIAELHVEQFKVDIVYVSDFSWLPWQADSLKRHVHVYLSGWYKTQKDRVPIPFSIKRENQDKIADAQRIKLESSSYIFSRGHLQTNGFWTKVAEPALVVATAATMVYLFFTVRS